MQVVDARGRLLERINLIDLGLLLFVALLLPLAYGAWMLFRTPPPRVTGVSPASLAFVRGTEQRVTISGQHLRPFLRAKLGTVGANNYAIITPESAEIRFADLMPGTYDVVLYDESQELTRLPKALTILPPPVQMAGTVAGGSSAGDRLAAGTKLGTTDRPIEVLSVERGADQRLATLRVTCQASPENRCLVGSVVVHPGVELTLPGEGLPEPVKFRVHDVRVDREWMIVNVRLMGLPESLHMVKPGQLDTRADPPRGEMADVTDGAVLRSLGEIHKGLGTFAITATQPQSAVLDLSRFGVLSAVLPVDARDAELLVPADPTPAGLQYRDGLLRPGGLMHFETPSYRLEALILSVAKPEGVTLLPEPR